MRLYPHLALVKDVPMTNPARPPLLEVKNVCASLGGADVLRNVNFSVAAGERLGIVGESGCGKTVMGLSILGLASSAFHLRGEIVFEGRNLLDLPAKAMRHVRGREISMIFQEPMVTLDPVFTIGEQICETLRTHFKLARKEAREQAIDALAQVGIPAPAERVDDYPHQLSGGMRQRAMIAIALACKPKLIIADEPTTALDVTVQAQITNLLVELSEKHGTALLFITHDLGVVAETCDRLITMYAGQVVENAGIDDFLARPLHPYSSGLLRSLPRMSKRKTALPSIPGRVPTVAEMPAGCRFEPRCSLAQAPCKAEQSLLPAGEARKVACCRYDELMLPGVLN
ncbi:Oligopeptide transport ATP-binding protein OppD [Ensifer psoraleae]|uniref:ABC transporter ATP-binding protein n=1 Tax=Sinorhizobium psoraleae TaxID=520838 RepID=UPI001AEDB47D|nr:ABC transporter ATP-binding protein [Sinorhizobium psoraleae]NRP72164.1 Oligopeptide transport ATP-binding protein OppD [Sinorhizobium psoraleae]